MQIKVHARVLLMVLCVSLNLAQALPLAQERAQVNALLTQSVALVAQGQGDQLWSAQWRMQSDQFILSLLEKNEPQSALEIFLSIEHLKARQLADLSGAYDVIDGAPPARQIERKSLRAQILRIDQELALARSFGLETGDLTAARHVLFTQWHGMRAAANAQLPLTSSMPPWAREFLNSGVSGVAFKFVGKTLIAVVINKGRTHLLVLDREGGVAPTIEAYRLAMRSLSKTFNQSLSLENIELPLWRLPTGGYEFSVQKPGAQEATRVEKMLEVKAFLSQKLIAPLLPYLEGQTKLIFSVDGNLGHVAFDALPVADQLLGQKYSLSVLPSFALYSTLSQRVQTYAAANPTRRSLLAFGGAHYALREQVSKNITMQRTQTNDMTLMDLKAVSQGLRKDPSKLASAMKNFQSNFADIPATQREVQDIAQQLQAAQSASPLVLTGTLASEAVFNRLVASRELEQFQYIHFAAHGFLSDDEPLLSSVVLSQVNRAAGTDGYLTVAELAASSMKADLVVVSACDSGAGSAVPGGGVLGLTMALFEAGAAASVVSLWPIPDKPSATFVARFYQELAHGVSSSQALQKAKDWGRSKGLGPHVTEGFVIWGI